MTKTILSRDALRSLSFRKTRSLSLRIWPGVEEKQHRVRARNVAVGDVGALQRQVVHAWRVDQQDALTQERCGVADLQVIDVLVGRRPLGDRGGVDGAASDGEALDLVEG